MTVMPRPSILSVEPYVGGESKIPGVNRVVKLSSNEGAFGPPPGAIEAIRAAMQALGECSPNGRDYQTAPKGEYEIARKAYMERFSFLDRMINELEDEAIAIQGTI